MTTAIEPILNALNTMRLPKGATLETRFEKNAEKLSNRLFATGGIIFALEMLLLLYCLWRRTFPGWLNPTVDLLTGAAAVAVFIGFVSAFAGVFHTMRTHGKFLHEYFIECVRTDAAHAMTLRTFNIADLQTARQILEMQIARHRNRLSVFVGSPDKVSILAVIALGWAGYGVFSPLLTSATLSIGNPTSWGVYALFVVGCVLAAALGAAMSVNFRVQRLIYQTQLIDIAMNTTLQPH